MNLANIRPTSLGERCSMDELAAMRRRFSAATSGWGLSEAESARLLGLDGCWRYGTLSPDAEARMRLLLDVDGLLVSAIGIGGTGDWLREPNSAFVGGLTPLEAMSLGRDVVRQIKTVLGSLVDGR